MQFCQTPGCPALVPSGYCREHRVRSHEIRSKAVHAWYGLKRWEDLRRTVLRNQPFCQGCLLRGLKTVGTEIDHIVPHMGDPALMWDLTNLQNLCKRCHRLKTTRGG